MNTATESNHNAILSCCSSGRCRRRRARGYSYACHDGHFAPGVRLADAY